jgi:hypothetical protein
MLTSPPLIPSGRELIRGVHKGLFAEPTEELWMLEIRVRFSNRLYTAVRPYLGIIRS